MHTADFVTDESMPKGRDPNINIIDDIHKIKDRSRVNILVSNYTNKHLTFHKGEYIGHLESIELDSTDQGETHHAWQYLGNNNSDTQLQHLVTIPSILVHKVYQYLLNSTLQLTPFNTKPSEDTDTLWSLFTHPGIYISALGSLIPVGIGLFCCYFFWCQPARLAH